MDEFKEQLDATEREKVENLIKEVKEIAVKGQAADPSVTGDAIREKTHELQKASLGLFQKVYEKKSAESKNAEASSEPQSEKTEEKKDQ